MGLDLINLWRSHERQYPIIFEITHDILTPPSSTIALESTFSAGDRILSEFRSQLKEDILERLM